MGTERRLTVCPLRQCALEQPDLILLQDASRSYSAVMMDSWVQQYYEAMLAQGLFLNSKLVVLVSDPLETILLALACLRAGVIFCPLNAAFPSEKIKAYCSAIEASAITGLVPEDVRVFSDIVYFLAPAKAEAFQIPLFEVAVDHEKIADLIATSGTTGVPKAVAHSYGNHYYSALGSQSLLPLTVGDSWLLSLPLFHVGGIAIVFRCLLARATMIVYEKGSSLLKHLSAISVTHLSLVNTQLYRLLEQDRADLGQLGIRYILLGGGTASAGLVKKAQQQGVVVLTTYGMTEMSSQVLTGIPVFTGISVSSGAILPYREAKVGGNSEILVRGKTLAMGYYRHGTLRALTDQEGWYHSGDLGYWHAGQVIVKGRVDNMLISGGENIHPEEIEQALMGLAHIIQAVVVSVNNDEFGQRPVAFVQTANGSLDELFTKQQLACRIARFKVPDRIRLFPHDDMFSGIKVNRRLFQQLADAQNTVAVIND